MYLVKYLNKTSQEMREREFADIQIDQLHAFVGNLLVNQYDVSCVHLKHAPLSFAKVEAAKAHEYMEQPAQ